VKIGGEQWRFRRPGSSTASFVLLSAVAGKKIATPGTINSDSRKNTGFEEKNTVVEGKKTVVFGMNTVLFK